MGQEDRTTVRVRGTSECTAADILDDSKLIGAYLWYDGYLAARNMAELVPITKPLYTIGRPQRDDVPGGTCYCVSTGGIPILSDSLFSFLSSLGAKGETATLTYRGFNKKAYNTVQAGFRRFLPSPTYIGQGCVEFFAEFPLPLPPVFGIRTTFQVKLPAPGSATEFHIGLSLDSLQQLKQSMPRVLVRPLYRVP